MNARTRFLANLTVLADMCGYTLSHEILQLYENGLAALGYENLNSVVEQFVFDRGSRDPFPSIREIREKLRPEVSDDQRAVSIAHRIWAAVSSFGWPNHKQAKAALGEAAWSTVEMAGGWVSVCQDANNSEPGIFKAQIRELAKVALVRVHVGDAELQRLPSRTNKPAGELVSLENVLRLAATQPEAGKK